MQHPSRAREGVTPVCVCVYHRFVSGIDLQFYSKAEPGHLEEALLAEKGNLGGEAAVPFPGERIEASLA